MRKYYSMSKESKKATLNIYGDIEGDISVKLSKRLAELDVDEIEVHINSYGGEVAEGLAIYNSLKNHKAKVTTYIDGFACSIASVIFMAGEERIMSPASLLMIHNAWTFAGGNANDLRKQADDLENITQASINAYMEHINISEAELKQLLDAETWLDYKKAIDYGFATRYEKEAVSERASQSVKNKIVKMIIHDGSEEEPEEEPKGATMKFKCEECGYIHEGELPAFYVCPECGADKDEFIEVEGEPAEEIEIEEEPTDEPEEPKEPVEPTDEPEEPTDNEEEPNAKAVQFFTNLLGGIK